MIHHVAWLGQLGLLQLLHEANVDGFSTKTMDFAAGAGHLEIVQFLHHHRKEGCTMYDSHLYAYTCGTVGYRTLYNNYKNNENKLQFAHFKLSIICPGMP
jgi:hypothetical protein